MAGRCGQPWVAVLLRARRALGWTRLVPRCCLQLGSMVPQRLARGLASSPAPGNKLNVVLDVFSAMQGVGMGPRAYRRAARAAPLAGRPLLYPHMLPACALLLLLLLPSLPGVAAANGCVDSAHTVVPSNEACAAMCVKQAGAGASISPATYPGERWWHLQFSDRQCRNWSGKCVQFLAMATCICC